MTKKLYKVSKRSKKLIKRGSFLSKKLKTKVLPEYASQYREAQNKLKRLKKRRISNQS